MKKVSAHDLFIVSLVLKVVESVAEIGAGLTALFISRTLIVRAVVFLTRGELLEDPRDIIANHLLVAAKALSLSGKEFIAVYLLAHGIVRLVLIIAIWYEKRWGYQLFAITLVIFMSYELYRLAVIPSVMVVFLAVFDAIVLALTIREYKARYY